MTKMYKNKKRRKSLRLFKIKYYNNNYIALKNQPGINPRKINKIAQTTI